MSKLDIKEFGFREGINEVIGVTEGISSTGRVNTAPIGVIVRDSSTFIRLFGESHTLVNLRNGSNLYANVCFDPVVFAISAFEDLDDSYFSKRIRFALKDSYSMCVFQPLKFTDMGDFVLCNLKFIKGFFVNPRSVRAFSRAFSAVIEAAILATRYRASTEEDEKLKKLGRIVDRCGGSDEKLAYSYILKSIRD